MFSGVKTTGCTDLFLFVHSCRRLRLPGFSKSVQKNRKKNTTLDARSSQFLVARRCTSMYVDTLFSVKVEQRGLGRMKPAVPLYLLVPLYHLLGLTLCARRQDLDWKEYGSVLSAHTAELVAAWQRAPGQMPPAVSRPPCAQY